jgi:steroid 5-alpha reductase family enzyme
MISNKLGWILMEGWALVAFWTIYIIYFNCNTYSLFFAGLYTVHYINRSFIFPLRTQTKGKQMPLMIALSAMLFNSVNASSIGFYLSNVTKYPADYFLHWNFIIGLILFVIGFYINYKSDGILIHLRKPGETGYKIPEGFLFRYISCPNHFGEMLEWLGFMLLVWNLAGVSFFVWTVSNLLPRALHHHKWYLQNFADYPKDRKAVFPFVI